MHTLTNQPGRQEERGGLRDAFQDGSSPANASPRGSASGGGHDGSPRLSVGSRGGGSNSPRLLAPLSTRSGTPPGDEREREKETRGILMFVAGFQSNWKT